MRPYSRFRPVSLFVFPEQFRRPRNLKLLCLFHLELSSSTFPRLGSSRAYNLEDCEV